MFPNFGAPPSSHNRSTQIYNRNSGFLLPFPIFVPFLVEIKLYYDIFRANITMNHSGVMDILQNILKRITRKESMLEPTTKG